MSGAKFHPGFWMGTHVADTTIVRSRDHGRSWDTEPKGFAVAPRTNIEALTMACWPGGYGLFVGDTEGTVNMSEDVLLQFRSEPSSFLSLFASSQRSDQCFRAASDNPALLENQLVQRPHIPIVRTFDQFFARWRSHDRHRDVVRD
jgi:hypothetical protein